MFAELTVVIASVVSSLHATAVAASVAVGRVGSEQPEQRSCAALEGVAAVAAALSAHDSACPNVHCCWHCHGCQKSVGSRKGTASHDHYCLNHAAC